jgi:hypothetical protein
MENLVMSVMKALLLAQIGLSNTTIPQGERLENSKLLRIRGDRGHNTREHSLVAANFHQRLAPEGHNALLMIGFIPLGTPVSLVVS